MATQIPDNMGDFRTRTTESTDSFTTVPQRQNPAGVSQDLQQPVEVSEKKILLVRVAAGILGGLMKFSGTVTGGVLSLFNNHVGAAWSTFINGFGLSDKFLGIALGEAPEKGKLSTRMWKACKNDFEKNLDTMKQIDHFIAGLGRHRSRH